MDQSFLSTLKSIEDKFSRCINASRQKGTNFTDILISVESDLKNHNIALTSKNNNQNFSEQEKSLMNKIINHITQLEKIVELLLQNPNPAYEIRSQLLQALKDEFGDINLIF